MPENAEESDNQEAQAQHSWRSLPKRAKGWISVTASVAALVGLYLTWQFRPQPFTLEDWAKKTNASCALQAGGIAANMTEAMDSLDKAIGGYKAGSPVVQHFHDAEKKFYAVAAGVSTLEGEFGSIDTPNKGESNIQ